METKFLDLGFFVYYKQTKTNLLCDIIIHACRVSPPKRRRYNTEVIEML